MKVNPAYLQQYTALDAWLGQSTQKENFLKVISVEQKMNNAALRPEKQETEKKQADDTISNKIIDAAENHIGRKYDEVNCYELVVESLEASGVDYRGKNGIAAYLASMAKAENRPVNAYMTGEGLVAAAGKHVYTRDIDRVDDPVRLSKEIAGEMKNRLEKGSILSFSMRSRGHTGIVSKAGSEWTFINSGKMDHNIRGGRLGKAVGEEPLEAEIQNWLKLSSRKNERLTITLGRFEDDKLAAFIKPEKQISMRV